MIAGVLFMAAAGYGLMRGVHIRADFLYRNWSDKTQATVDASLYLAFFLPSMLLFTWISTKFFMVAYLTGETAFDSTWSPVLWPARIAMPIGGASVVLARFLQNCSAPFTKWESNANVPSFGSLRQQSLSDCYGNVDPRYPPNI